MTTKVQHRAEPQSVYTRVGYGFNPPSQINPGFPWGNGYDEQYLRWTNTFDGIVEKRATDWIRQIAKGLDATTSASYVSSEMHVSEGIIGCFIQYNATQVQWSYFDKPQIVLIADTSPSKTLSQLQELADIAFLQKARQVQSQFQSLTFLGELKETIELIVRPAKLVSKLLVQFEKKSVNAQWFKVLRDKRAGRLVPKGVFKKARTLASNEWLEFRFGIKPLLGDIDSGMKALAQFYTYVPRQMVVVEKTSKNRALHMETGGAFYVRWDEHTSCEAVNTVKLRGMIRLVGPDNGNPLIAKHFGFSWGDAILAGWELLPYSFVIDYFLNVGDVIEAALFPLADLNWVNITRKSVVEKKGWITNVRPYQGYQSYDDSATDYDYSVTSSTVTCERERNYPISTPSLHFKVPGYDSLQWVNLGALFVFK